MTARPSDPPQLDAAYLGGWDFRTPWLNPATRGGLPGSVLRTALPILSGNANEPNAYLIVTIPGDGSTTPDITYQCLRDDSGDWAWQALGNGNGNIPSGPAGGDLSGTYPDPTVDTAPAGALTGTALAANVVTASLTAIIDANGNNVLTFTPTASAVSYINITNAATGAGNAARIQVVSGDTNSRLDIRAAGTGSVDLAANRTDFFRMDGGTGTVFIQAVGGSANVGVRIGAKGSGVPYFPLEARISAETDAALQVIRSSAGVLLMHVFSGTGTLTNAQLQLTGLGTGTGSGVMVEAAGGRLGFYGTVPIALQTGVAVSAAGIHAALVALGLITA